MEKHILDILLQKLADNTIRPQEEALLREYMDRLSEEELDMLFPSREWDAVVERHPQPADSIAETETAYRAVAAKLNLPVSPPVITMQQSRPWWRRTWIQAACMAGLIICSTWLYMSLQKKKQGLALAEKIAWTEISTAQGEYHITRLPDGSSLYLNGGSLVKYPERFSGNTRQIQLIAGEIFIEVQRNERMPFIVKTGDREVKVLGTSFTVQNRPGDKQIIVAVKTGKVTFGSPGTDTGSNALLLTPGKKGVFEKQTGRLHETTCPINSIAGWRNDEFTFEDATLPEILEALQYHYDFQYRITNRSLEKKHFKATFRQRKPDEIVRVLAKMGDFNYYKKDSVIVIY